MVARAADHTLEEVLNVVMSDIMRVVARRDAAEEQKVEEEYRHQRILIDFKKSRFSRKPVQPIASISRMNCSLSRSAFTAS
jgi:hypothetical protein